MEINEYVTLNYPERNIFSDIELQCNLIIRECKSVLDHDTTYHDSLKKSYNRQQMIMKCVDIFSHAEQLEKKLEKLNEFEKSLTVSRKGSV